MGKTLKEIVSIPLIGLMGMGFFGCEKKEIPPPAPKPAPIAEKVKRAPTLTEVGNVWAEMYWANRHKVKESGNLIYAGQRLFIPATNKEYTVQEGENLWTIAEEAAFEYVNR